MIITKTHVFSIVVIAFAIVSLAILIWGFDKGFNLGDAGYYLLRYQQIQPSELNGWMFDHILVKLVIPPSLRTIKSLRYIGLIINLMGTLLFAFSISRLFQKMHAHRVSLALLSIMMLGGFLISYTGMPCELSYNSMTQFFLISTTALIVLSIINEGILSLIYAALAGLAGSFVLLTKLPSGLAMIIVASLVLISSSGLRKGRLIAYWGTCLTLAVLGIISLKLDINSYIKGFHAIMIAKGNYSGSMFVHSISTAIVMIFKLLGLSVLISTSFWLSSRKRNNKIQQAAYFYIGLFLLTLFYSSYIDEHVKGFEVSSSFFVMTVFLLFQSWMFSNIKLPNRLIDIGLAIKQNLRFLPLLIFLFAVPYIGAFGSNIKLDRMSRFYYVSFMGLVVLLLPFQKRKLIKAIAIVFSIYLSIIGLYQYVQYPVADGPLYKQTDYFKGIRYNPDTAKMFYTIEDILKTHGFISEQGMIVAYTASGLVYLMGTYQPGGPLWTSDDHKIYFEKLKKTALQYKPVIVSMGSELNVDFKSGLYSATGLNVENEYQIEKTYYAYEDMDIYIYVPYSSEMTVERIW